MFRAGREIKRLYFTTKLCLEEQRKQLRYGKDLCDAVVKCLVMGESRGDQPLSRTEALKTSGECLVS